MNAFTAWSIWQGVIWHMWADALRWTPKTARLPATTHTLPQQQ